MYAWWTPDQLEAAQNTALTWTRTFYDAGDHDHCLLTWATIRRGDVAFVSDAGWITDDAYRRYIQDDELQLQRGE